MATSDIIESTREASRGGFQGIEKIRGLLASIKKVSSRFTEGAFGPPKDQIEFTLEDAMILKMFPGEEIFDLQDNRFVGWETYAVEGKTPSANGTYMKCWVASAEELGKKPSEFIGSYVTLEKQPRKLFSRYEIDEETKKPKLDEDGEKIKVAVFAVDQQGRANHYCFTADETVDSGDVKAYVRQQILGKNTTAARRELVMENRIKRFPEFKEMHANGTLAEYLGLVVVDGKYQEPEGEDEECSAPFPSIAIEQNPLASASK